MPHGRGGDSGSVDGDTVFVRNLAYDVTDETLAAHCSDAGAVRRAVVVRERKGGESRGFGFVTFAVPEDAQSAVRTLGGSVLQGRKISVHMNTGRAAGAEDGGAAAAAGGRKRERAETGGAGAPSAAPARKRREGSAAENPKSFRLIVRNLAFTCSAEALREAFEPHGVVEASVPMRPNGKHPGFGFVQMSSRAACDAAIAGLNEQKIGGRMVAVDFALSKTAYERAVGAPAAPKEAAAAAPPPKSEAAVAEAEEEEEEAEWEQERENIQSQSLSQLLGQA